MALAQALVLYDPMLNAWVLTFQPPFVPRLPLALSSSSQVSASMIAYLYACIFINHDVVVVSPSTQVLQTRSWLFSTPKLPDSFSSINKFG